MYYCKSDLTNLSPIRNTLMLKSNTHTHKHLKKQVYIVWHTETTKEQLKSILTQWQISGSDGSEKLLIS